MFFRTLKYIYKILSFLYIYAKSFPAGRGSGKNLFYWFVLSLSMKLYVLGNKTSLFSLKHCIANDIKVLTLSPNIFKYYC